MGQAGSRMGTWLAAAQKTNPEYDLVAAPQPSTEKGKKQNLVMLRWLIPEDPVHVLPQAVRM